MKLSSPEHQLQCKAIGPGMVQISMWEIFFPH